MQVSDAGLVHLKEMTTLRRLYLSETSITKAGLVHLKGLAKLQTVHPDGSRATDTDVNELQQALPNCKITKEKLAAPPAATHGSPRRPGQTQASAMTLRNLSFHIGDVSAPPGDPSRLIDRFPTVQRAAFSVANHYMANLHNVTLDREAKLILQVNPQMEELDGDRIEWMDNIRLIPVPFPLEDAAQLTGTPLKATILECIQNSLLWYAALKGESSVPFESAYRTVVDASLVYAHYYKRGKSWKAPSGKRKFKLFVVFEWDRIDVYAEVMCGRTTEGYLLLHSTVPVEYPYPSLIQGAKWSGNQNISLSTFDFATASKKAVKQSINNLTPGPVSR